MKQIHRTECQSFYYVTTHLPDDNGHWRITDMELAIADNYGDLCPISNEQVRYSLKDGEA